MTLKTPDASRDSERSPESLRARASSGDLASSAEIARPCADASENFPTLISLPVGARLILRCRKDWRYATISTLERGIVVLSVSSPSGHSYRVRRPADALISLDGPIPILGEGQWRTGLARYDTRW